MERKKEFVLVLLSVIVPMSLFGVSRFIGLLEGPITETTTLEAIRWEFKRPDVRYVYIDEALNSAYSDSEISTIMTVRIGEYVNDDPAFGDFVTFEVSTNLTTTIPNSFIEDVYVGLHSDYQSPVGWLHTDFRPENLSILGLSDWGWPDTKAYIDLRSVNRSKGAYFSALALWSLKTPNYQTHQWEVAFELTYYNGTAYKKAIQPFQLKLLGAD